MVTHTQNSWLCIYPSKCTQQTHIVNTHPEQWAAIYAVAPREQLGVRCLAQGHLVLVFTPPTYNPDRDSNSQPFNYESESLTIRSFHYIIAVYTNSQHTHTHARTHARTHTQTLKPLTQAYHWVYITHSLHKEDH